MKAKTLKKLKQFAKKSDFNKWLCANFNILECLRHTTREELFDIYLKNK